MIKHYRIVAPHFVAGVTVNFDGQYVSVTPPILRWAVGRDWVWFMDYIKRKHWGVEEICIEDAR